MEKSANKLAWKRPATPYEEFCAAQGVPIYRGIIGIEDVRSLERGPWERMAGRGAIIDLDGTGGLLGIYIIEIPPGEALNAERHLYEEVFYVLEGTGTCEIWIDGQKKPSLFEWEEHSLFTAPLNTWHRIVNASRESALLLVGTNAPPVMDMFQDESFIFDVPFVFKERYRGSSGFFDPWEELETDHRGRARNASALIPDVVNCVVPLDGQRGAGHRYFRVQMGGNFFRGHIAEYPSGRYSKTHAHESGPVLVCLSGHGYTLTWPKSAGTTPWKDGRGDEVLRQDYGPGGLVSAAPGGADWFHAHFGTSREPFRVMALLGGYPRLIQGAPGSRVISRNEDINKGGNTIEYHNEDPRILEIFQEELTKNSVELDMDPELYHSPESS